MGGRGHAATGPHDRVLGGGAVPWAITQLGNAAVEAWVSRCLSMFGGWPPDHPEVDDATG